MKFKGSSKFFAWREKHRRKSNPGWMVFLGTHHQSFSTLRFWVSELMRGCTDTNDEPRSGRTKTTTRPEILNKIHDLALEDR